MKSEFKKCLEQKKIYLAKDIQRVARKELETAKGDLRSSKRDFRARDFKWSISQSYYAMFHAARALLYFAGYKERSHYCLAAALEHLFSENETISAKLINSLTTARKLRELADYESEYTKKSAEIVLERAEEFIATAEKVLFQKRKK